MRIGLVIDNLDPRRGGQQVWTIQFLRQLARRGHEVHLIASELGGSLPELPVIYHHVPAGSHMRFAEQVEKLLGSLDLDIIHDTGCGWACDVFQPHHGTRRGVFERKLQLLPRWLRPLKRLLFRLTPRYREFEAIAARQFRSDGRVVLALSERVASDMRRYYHVAPEAIRVVYNGVDTERFAPDHRARYRRIVRERLGVAESTTLLLIVAHNFVLKGVPTLLNSLKRLTGRGHDIHLAVVGRRTSRRCLRTARQLGVESHVTFLGPTDDTMPFYAAADVYTHPTLYDSCSLSLLEAMASGLPVITTTENGASELITHGVEGYVLSRATDVAALVDLIARLEDPHRRETMGAAARHTVLQHTLLTNCDEIEAIYREIVAQRDRGRAVEQCATDSRVRRPGPAVVAIS